jgi:hypothetical protein
MDIFSHILWTYVPFRNKLWRDEALFFAILPDFGFLLIFLYVLFGTPTIVGFPQALPKVPDILLVIYFTLHSFVTLGIVALIIWRLKPRLLPALSGWFIHIMLDIPVHDGYFGTRFLYPILPDLYISGISWVDYRVLAVSYLALVIVYAYSLRRERRKRVMRDEWRPDWIDKIHMRADALINRERIRASDAEVSGNGGTTQELSGEDRGGTGQGEDQPAGEDLSQDDGR